MKNLICAVTVLAVSTAQAATIHVDAGNCPGPGMGTVRDPYCSIQTAIDNAVDAVDTDEIVVAPGTYFEAINFDGKAITLRSSDGAEVTTIDGTGNFHVVQCVSGEGPETVLDGFTITGGSASSFPDNVGGGMYNSQSSPTVTNCTFLSNTVGLGGFGGGMYNTSSSPTVNNCIFEANFVSGFGGGMANVDGSPTVTNCTFVSNQARQGGLQNGGGGMYNSHSDAMVTSCVFTFNISSVAGGAMFNDNSSPTVTDCTFNFNTAGTGGAIENDSSDASVVRCRFTGNTAFFGGAIRNLTSSPDFLNCSFIDNSVPLNGGGMFSLFASTPTLTNCTFSGNVGAEGAAIFNDSGTTTVSNSILWGDSSSEIAGSGTTNVTDSAVEGGWPGIGNIDADPVFVDPDNGDFRLSTDSPCIDAGDNTAVPEGVLRDLDGNPRFVADACAGASGATVDMGAYEFQGTSCDLSNIMEMLASWGSCRDCGTCPADFDGDCSVGILDLLILLGNRG